MLKDASRGKSVQVFVDAVSNHRENQTGPFEHIWVYECLNVSRDISHSPLSEVAKWS